MDPARRLGHIGGGQLWRFALRYSALAIHQRLRNDFIFRFDQAARILLRRYGSQSDIAGQFAEQRNPVSNEHRHSRDDQALNESSAEKVLDGDASVDVEMPRAAR